MLTSCLRRARLTGLRFTSTPADGLAHTHTHGAQLNASLSAASVRFKSSLADGHGRVHNHAHGAHSSMTNSLHMDEIDRDLFLQSSKQYFVPPGSRGIFGGHIIGSAMLAAQKTTTSGYPLHSMKCWFLLPGDRLRPIVYSVTRLRDGASFETRSVTAKQNGAAIFEGTFSFHKEELSGFDHQVTMPAVPDPESLPSLSEQLSSLLADPRLKPAYAPLVRSTLEANFPVDVRPCAPRDVFDPQPQWPAKQYVWMRCTETLRADPLLHRSAVAYASDWQLCTTALLPYRATLSSPMMKMVASIDHVMYFHDSFQQVPEATHAPAAAGAAAGTAAATGPKPVSVRQHPDAARGADIAVGPRGVRADEWMLYAMDAPVMRNNRGLNLGHIFTRSGRLVTTVMQEALYRLKQECPHSA